MDRRFTPCSEETKRKIGLANSTGKKPNFDRLYDLYITQRLSSLKIAVILDVSKPTILKWLKFYQIEVRNRSDCIRGNKFRAKANYNQATNTVQRSRFGLNMRPLILERDNYTCTICNKRGNGELHVDHIKGWENYPELRFEPSNCRTVCRPCHYYITFKKEYDGVSSWGTRKRGLKLYGQI